MKVSYLVGAMVALASVAEAAVNCPAVLVGALAASLAATAAAAEDPGVISVVRDWKPIYDPRGDFPCDEGGGNCKFLPSFDDDYWRSRIRLNKGTYAQVICSNEKFGIAAVDTEKSDTCPGNYFAMADEALAKKMFERLCVTDDSDRQQKILKNIEAYIEGRCYEVSIQGRIASVFSWVAEKVGYSTAFEAHAEL